MVIQNIQTKVKYPMPRSSWDALGKNQRLFKVLVETDELEVPVQIIDNVLKPPTGEKNKKDTSNNPSKKK